MPLDPQLVLQRGDDEGLTDLRDREKVGLVLQLLSLLARVRVLIHCHLKFDCFFSYSFHAQNIKLTYFQVFCQSQILISHINVKHVVTNSVALLMI